MAIAFTMLITIAASASTALLLLAALRDIASRIIPNAVALAIAGLGVALRIRAHDLPISLAAAAALFLLAAFCWRRGWMGGGDVKLLAAAALLLPPRLVPGYVLAVALAGGVLGLLYLGLGAFLRRRAHAAAPRRSASLLRRTLRAEAWRIRRRFSLPYGCAIAAGALFALLQPGALA